MIDLWHLIIFIYVNVCGQGRAFRPEVKCTGVCLELDRKKMGLGPDSDLNKRSGAVWETNHGPF